MLNLELAVSAGACLAVSSLFWFKCEFVHEKEREISVIICLITWFKRLISYYTVAIHDKLYITFISIFFTMWDNWDLKISMFKFDTIIFFQCRKWFLITLIQNAYTLTSDMMHFVCGFRMGAARFRGPQNLMRRMSVYCIDLSRS